MNNFAHRLKHLLEEMIPPTLFFFFSFEVIAITDALILNQYGIELGKFATVAVLALVVAKVVLLTNLLPFVNRFPDKPIIYNIVWKASIYFFASFVARYLEELIHFLRQGNDFIAANQRMIDEFLWTRFWAIQIWLSLSLLVYCAGVELVRVLGGQRILEIFFGRAKKAGH